MNKIDDFLKEHDLKSELLNDESFVNDSKKLFKEQGVEFSKEQFEKIIGGINDNLNNVRKLPAEELLHIAGGQSEGSKTTETIPYSKSSSGAGGIAIKATTTILGAVLGAGLGLVLNSKYKYSTVKDSKGEVLRKEYAVSSSPLPAVIGGGMGGILGAKIGDMIVKKYHL